MSQNSSTSIPHLILSVFPTFFGCFLPTVKKRFYFLVEYYKHILQSVCVCVWMDGRQKKIHNTLCISHNIWLELTTTTTTNRKSRGEKIRLKIRFWRLEFVCFGFIGFSSMLSVVVAVVVAAAFLFSVVVVVIFYFISYQTK